MRILVCLPTYNEELNVKPMIERIRNLSLDVVVIDGQSTDRTVPIAKDLDVEVLEREGFGKGSAIIKCMEYAESNGYDKVITIDCDQTYFPEDIPKIVNFADQYDMVVGVRPIQNIAFLRRLANHAMNFMTNLLYKSNVKDMATGFRLMDVKKFKPFLNAQSFDIEPQIYAVGLRENFKITEVDIRYSKRVGDSKVNILHFFAIIYRLFVERFK